MPRFVISHTLPSEAGRKSVAIALPGRSSSSVVTNSNGLSTKVPGFSNENGGRAVRVGNGAAVAVGAIVDVAGT